ncbi:serine/threonine-protein kinase [Kitasatospora herbaricolor]|uniref:non-specific serine/threonine protein kinase n=2 Tax=Kitasatospora herbaricolor TaxID=68217 RepID=A0ABZ1WGS0_9ACTN|nr:serine/threonine-protein kinase [Kitasatospora herbaricolor]
MERRLGAGGQGEAWLAYDNHLRRRVVVKRLTVPEGVSAEANDVRVARAEREARAAGALSHPGIVTVFDQFSGDDGLPWTVMEYVEGPSLREALESGPLPVRQAARIGAQIASALVVAHAAEVIHRDIKPANILLADERTVVADFGIASVPDEVTLTATGVPIGTPQFMAPEQLNAGRASTASDMWSLGATLYCAVEGRSPFPGSSLQEVLLAVARGVPEPMRTAGALEPVIDQLMRLNPDERPSAAVTAASLREIVEGLEAKEQGAAAIDRLLGQATEEREKGALDRAEDTYWTALDLAIQRNAPRQQGWAWDGLGSCRWRAGDPETAMRFFTRAARMAEVTDDALMGAWSLHNFGTYWRGRGEPARATDFFRQALSLANAHQCAAAAGWTHHQLAELAAEAGDTRQEKEHYAAAARIGSDAGDYVLSGWSLFNTARCEERAHDLQQAREHYAQAKETGLRISNRWMVEQSEEGLQRLTTPA